MKLTTEQLAELEQLKENFKRSQNQKVDQLFADFIARHNQTPTPTDTTAAAQVSTQVLLGDFCPISSAPLPPSATSSSASNYDLVIDERTTSSISAEQETTPNDNSLNGALSIWSTTTATKRPIDLNDSQINVKLEEPDDETESGKGLMLPPKKRQMKSFDISHGDGGDVGRNEATDNASQLNGLIWSPPTSSAETSHVMSYYFEDSPWGEDDKGFLFSGGQGPLNGETNTQLQMFNNSPAPMHQVPPRPSSVRPTESHYQLLKMGKQQQTRYKFAIISLNCPIEGCREVSPTQQAMNQHLNQPHPNSVPLYFCPTAHCSRPYHWSGNDLIQHANTEHRYNSVWPCTKCPQVFESAQQLVTHQFFNHFTGHFGCVHCSFTGTTRQIMCEHFAEQHNITSRYSTIFSRCTAPYGHCTRTFATKEQLNAHLQQEHKLLPFLCLASNCGRSFVSRGELDRHVQKYHSNIIVWQCPVPGCTEPTFTEASLLYKHVYTHHHTGHFKCMRNGCNYNAEVRIDVIRHYSLYHGGRQ